MTNLHHIHNVKRVTKRNKLTVKVVYKNAEDLPESELQRIWDRAFGILFDEVNNDR